MQLAKKKNGAAIEAGNVAYEAIKDAGYALRRGLKHKGYCQDWFWRKISR